VSIIASPAASHTATVAERLMTHEATRGGLHSAEHDNILLPRHAHVDMSKAVVVNAPEPQPADSSGSGSSGESDQEAPLGQRHDSIDDADEVEYQFAPAVTGPPSDDVTPLSTAGGYSWTSAGPPRTRTMGDNHNPPPIQTSDAATRPTRPVAPRTLSNAYAPPRRPQQFSLNTSGGKSRMQSAARSRRNPNAEYRAQEKAYVQRIRQENEQDEFIPDLQTPSLGYSTGTDSDDESPSTAEYNPEGDPYDQETLLYYGNDDLQPSVEELKIPENRERLEWHSMLASVLTGDVVKQEKKRLIGSTEQQGDNSMKAEIWIGVRARVCGRSLQAQRRLVDDGRTHIKTELESIASFEVQGAAEAGQTAAAQVEEIVKKIEKIETLYPTRQALEAAYPRAGSQAFKDSCDAVCAWHNTTALINTEMSILKKWVGNEELDFSKPRARTAQDHHLTDDSSFIDRILKEDGLKPLQGQNSLLVALEKVIYKAKATLIANAEGFAERHLPPYIEELLTLINFPSRLLQEIIRVRLSYARNIRDPSQQGIMMAEQMISQFQILLTLAGKLKESYIMISRTEPGWDLPVCIEENFDQTVLDALKFYFKMLNLKLSANKNTFKEAEILEQEWEFCNKLVRHFEGGDVEVAEQFRYADETYILSISANQLLAP
jgi:mitogen-activated protein kinase kinase kinase